MPINAPSLANQSLVEFGWRLNELKESGVDFFHIDLMDGHYVPSLCLPPRTVRDVKELCPEAIAEVHLMVEEPMTYLDELQQNGADWVSFHLDSTRFVRRTLAAIRERGMKAGVVLNPSQPVKYLLPVLPWVDYVVFMAVEPGFAGQKFLPGSMERLAELCDLRCGCGNNFKIVLDGGVTYEIGKQAAELGVDVLVTGIYMIFAQPDGIAGAVKRFNLNFNNQ